MIRKLQAFPTVRGVVFAVGVFVAAVLVLASEKAAFAQGARNFGDQGQLAITAENLFGFSMERIGIDQPNNTERSETFTNFGLFHRATNFRGPWVGAHYFVIPNLSIGATLGILTTGGSTTQTNSSGTTVTTDKASGFTFVAIPKVGYALMMTNALGFWFRGGPGVYTSTSSSPNTDASSNTTFWFLSLDALFVVTPVQNFGFYVGPQGNFSFAGSSSSTNNSGVTVSQDSTFRSFSIDAGIFGHFDL